MLHSNFMIPALELVSRIQQLDQHIGSLEKEIAALPKHIAEIEKQLVSHARKLEAGKANLAANAKERKTLEGSIQESQAKISKLRDQMLQAKTNEQYRAFQNEIGHFDGSIRKAEDRILELMEEAEPLDAEVGKLEGDLKLEKRQVDSEMKQARERTAVDQQALAEDRSKRGELVKELDPAVYNKYERVRKKIGSNAVCEVVDGRCGGCRLTLRPQFFQEVKFATQLYNCENCERFLFYNAPVAPPV